MPKIIANIRSDKEIRINDAVINANYNSRAGVYSPIIKLKTDYTLQNLRIYVDIDVQSDDQSDDKIVNKVNDYEFKEVEDKETGVEDEEDEEDAEKDEEDAEKDEEDEEDDAEEDEEGGEGAEEDEEDEETSDDKVGNDDKVDENMTNKDAQKNLSLYSNHVEYKMLYDGIYHNNIVYVRLALTRKVDINKIFWLGKAALHLLFDIDRTNDKWLEILKFIMSYRPMIDIQDTWGCTPLHYAVKNGNANATRILLSLGADKNIKNEIGKTPLDVASDYKYNACKYMLLFDEP